MPRDLGRHARGGRLQRAVRDHPGDQSHAVGLGGLHHPPGEQEVPRMRPAQDVQQPPDAIARVEAERHLGKPEPRRGLGDPQVLGDGQHEAAAEGIAVHGGDGDLWQAGEALDDPGPARGDRASLVGRERRHLGDVVAGAEGAAAPGHDHDRDLHERYGR